MVLYKPPFMSIRLKLSCTHAHTGWNKNNMFELYTNSPHGQQVVSGSNRSQSTRLRGAYAHNPRAYGGIAPNPRAYGEQSLTTQNAHRGQSLAAHALMGSKRSQPTRSRGAIAHRPRGAIQPPLSTRSLTTHSARHTPATHNNTTL